MSERHDALLAEFITFSPSAINVEHFMLYICQRLHEEMARYNWIAFYLVDKIESRMLVLGPNIGSLTTPHMHCGFDEGLCGAAARSLETVVVDNLARDARVLMDSVITKSEIVAPILAGQEFVGEIDINSYFTGTFSGEDRVFVEACADLVGKYLEMRKLHSDVSPQLPSKKVDDVG